MPSEARERPDSTPPVAAGDTVLTAFPPGRDRRRVSRAQLVNILNRVNFRNGEIHLAFRDPETGRRRLLPARPGPCRGAELECRWVKGPGRPEVLAHLDFTGFTLGDGMRRFEVAATLLAAGSEGARLALPDSSFDVGNRRTRRHPCPDVAVEILQEGCELAGRLASFSAAAFAVSLPPLVGAHLNPDAPATVTLRCGAEVLFAEECRMIREGEGDGEGTTVFVPASSSLRRFKAKRIRSDRHRPRPLPVVTFDHPLTGCRVSLRATDISGAGVAVEEEARRAVLLPGLVLPAVRVEFLPGSAVTFRALVLHGKETEDGSRRSGLAILDMDPGEHMRLCAIVHRCRDEDSHVCTTNVDLEALWDFFFETGFLYPEKYAHIQKHKESFLELYKRLYHRAPTLSRHIIYQDRGVICGHVSMFRYHRATWLLHHHAAITSLRHRAGVVVMEHMLRYINEFHHLPAARMKHLAVYFRPNNRFANRVFGGTVRLMEDSSKSSLDDFAYLHPPAACDGELPAGWDLVAAREEDLAVFAHGYRERSGGLLPAGLDLFSDGIAADAAVDREYREHGLKRRRSLHALREGGATVVLLALNISDFGLNLSDLTNCIQAFVVRPERLPAEVVLRAAALLARRHPNDGVPLLVHPLGYANEAGLAYEKIYSLGILDMEHFDTYLEAFARNTASRTLGGRERGTRGNGGREGA